MAEYRPTNMMARGGYSRMPMDYRSPMANQRMTYQKPEPECGQKEKVYKEEPGMVAGMAYVPWQKKFETYELDKGFMCGTIFPELDKKFLCAGGGCR